jgi:hypothetical protein
LKTGEIVRATAIICGTSVRIANKTHRVAFSDSKYLGNADLGPFELGNVDPNTPSPVKRRKPTAQPVTGNPRPVSSPRASDAVNDDLAEEDWDTDVYCSSDEEEASSCGEDPAYSVSGDQASSSGDNEGPEDKPNAEADASSADEDSSPAQVGVPPINSNPIENDDSVDQNRGTKRERTEHEAEEVTNIDPFVNDSPDRDGDSHDAIEALQKTITSLSNKGFTNIIRRRHTEALQHELEFRTERYLRLSGASDQRGPALLQCTMDLKARIEWLAGYSRSAVRDETGSGIFSSATSPVLKKEPVSSDTGDDPQSCINVFKAIKTI